MADFHLQSGASVPSKEPSLDTWPQYLFETIFIQPAGHPLQLWRLDCLYCYPAVFWLAIALGERWKVERKTRLTRALRLLTFSMPHDIRSCLVAFFPTVQLPVPDTHFCCQILLFPSLLIPSASSPVQILLLPFC